MSHRLRQFVADVFSFYLLKLFCESVFGHDPESRNFVKFHSPEFSKKSKKNLRVVPNLHQLFSLRRLYLDQNPLQYFLFLSSFAPSFVVL